MICEKCGKEFFVDWRKNKKGFVRYCSRKCSNSREVNEAVKEKIKDSVNQYYTNKGIHREIIYCEKCGKKLSFNNKSGLCVQCANKKKREKYVYCNKCGNKLAFNNKIGICSNCNTKISLKAEHVRNFRRRKKQMLVDYKGGKCQICGYNKCNDALVFHHLDETQKDFNISHKNIVSLEIYKKEADKCILVCCNCHKEIHAGIINLED